MKTQRALGLDVSRARLIAVFLIDVAILMLVNHLPDELRIATYVLRIGAYPRWVGIGMVALVTITALTTYRAVRLTSVLAGRILDRFVDPEAALTNGRTRAIDHRRRYGSGLVGIREHRHQLAAVVAVGSRTSDSSGRHHRETKSPVVLPVPLVAAGLRQFDVRLEGIDIVSVAACEDAARNGDGHSAPRDRATWLVLRMDPQHNVAAIAARDSVASTLAAAAERLAHDLDGQHISARAATAEEFDRVDAAVLAGLQPAHLRLRRRRLKQKRPKEFSASFWVSPRDITSANLERLWLPETDATVVTVRLTPRRRRTQVSVLVRYHSGGRLRRKVRAGLNRLTGRQLSAVHASLPTPVRHRGLVVPVRELNGEDQLVVPLDDPAPEQEHPRVRVGTHHNGNGVGNNKPKRVAYAASGF